MKIRYPQNAGSWYAGTAEALRHQIREDCFLHPLGPGAMPRVTEYDKGNVKALICPHAGYMYSGPIAAHSYKALAEDRRPEIIVVLGPNHTGIGSGVSIMLEGTWRTPLGDTRINSDAAKDIQRNSTYIDVDDKAHAAEHSIELQLPFIQYLYGSEVEFVPICMLIQDLDFAIDVGNAVAKTLKTRKGVIIASSDMTHYEPHDTASRKDAVAIERMKTLDAEGLYDAINRFGISMCGYGPIVTAITASKLLNAKMGSLLKYSTSGDVVGDRSAVVGYCAMAFT